MSQLDDDGYGSVPTDDTNHSAIKTQKRLPRPAFTRRRSSIDVYRTFLGDFNRATGAWLIILLGFLTALGMGSLVGVVPQIMTQRYAEELFGYDAPTNGNAQCYSFSVTDLTRPAACRQGANYAQSAASYCALAKNTLALLSNSVAGSYSDRHGRRGELATFDENVLMQVLTPANHSSIARLFLLV